MAGFTIVPDEERDLNRYKRTGSMEEFIAMAHDVVKNDPVATEEIDAATNYYEEQQRLNDKLLKELNEAIDRNYRETMSSINKGLNRACNKAVSVARGCF